LKYKDTIFCKINTINTRI